MISPNIEQHVWAIIAEACSHDGIAVFKIGGIDDHVHLAIGIPATLPVAVAIGRIKGRSSRRICQDVAGMQDFAWQAGYSAFTISEDHLKRLLDYIDSQRSHHRR